MAEGWGLALPFIAVRSVGGPYDDEAFAAGYDLGKLHEQMRRGQLDTLEVTVRSALVGQLDLCAMDAGWVVADTELTDVEEWRYVTLRRQLRHDNPNMAPG